MSQILRKWIADHAVNNDKIDWTDTYTIAGLRVDETNAIGRVGIGISNPLDALHIRRTDTSAGIILDLDDGGDGQSYQLYSDQSGVFNIKDLDSGEVRFTITSPNASLGRIGINDSTPQDTIHARSILEGAALRLDTDDGFSGRAYRLLSHTNGNFQIIDADIPAVRLQIAPNGTLTYFGDATFEENFQINGTVTVINTEVVIADMLEINQTDDQPALIVSQDTPGTTATVMLIENAGDGYALTIDRGYVGIGTLTPGAMLHVQGDIFTADGSNIGDPTHRIGTLYMDSTIDYLSNLNFSSSGVHVTFATDGNVGIGSEVPVHALDVVGDIVGNADITATNNITALTGDITASAGSIGANQSVTAGTTVTAVGNITSTTGNVQATAGNLLALAGSVRALDMTATVGDIVAAGQLQGATLNITTGPSDITGVTSVIGDFTVKNATNVQCRVSRIGDGSAVFGISNGVGNFGWGNYTSAGDSLIQSLSTGNKLHIGSLDQAIPTMTFLSTGNAQVNGNDLGSSTVQDKLVIGSAISGDSIGISGDGYGIHFLHRNAATTQFQSRISSVIAEGGSGSDIVLSPSRAAQPALEVFRISRTSATSEEITLKHENDTTAFRVKTFYSGTSYLSTTDIGAIDGGQTHITYGAELRGISILSQGAFQGFVGIGITTPTEKLHVVGNGLFTGSLTANSLTIPTLFVEGPGNVEIRVSKTDSPDGTGIFAVTDDNGGAYGWDAYTDAGDTIIQSSAGKKLHLGTDDLSAPTMSLNSDGSAGIGITTPLAPLHVVGNIIATGDVGIGTTSPAAALDVNGSIFTAYGADIGDNIHRVDTLYMDGTCTINYQDLMTFNDSTVNSIKLWHGFVGIGITPRYTLHLQANGPDLILDSLTGARNSEIRIERDVGEWVRLALRGAGTDYFNWGSFPVGDSVLQVSGDRNLYIGSSGNSAPTITIPDSTTYGQSVGIGTTQPTVGKLLDVNGDSLFRDFVSLEGSMLAVGDGTAIYAGHFTSDTAVLTLDVDSSNVGGQVIRARMLNTSSTTGSAAVLAQNYGNGHAVRATTSGTGRAIYGFSTSGYAGYFDGNVGFPQITSYGSPSLFNLAVDSAGDMTANSMQVFSLSGLIPTTGGFDIPLGSYSTFLTSNSVYGWNVTMKSNGGNGWYPEHRNSPGDTLYFETFYQITTNKILVGQVGATFDNTDTSWRCVIWYHT